MSQPGFDALVAQLLADRDSASKPPVHKWDPPLSGDIDIRIAKGGRWFHEGDEIKRASLGALFASILKRENDRYFLVTPAEKWRISVADVPFYMIGLEVVERNGEQALVFTSSTNDTVVADAEHPLSVTVDDISGEPSPYIVVRDNMKGRLSRNVYYELAEFARPRQSDPEAFEVTSMGVWFPLA